jgi:hypothetical protein
MQPEALQEFQLILRQLVNCYLQSDDSKVLALFMLHEIEEEQLHVRPLHHTDGAAALAMLRAATQAYGMAMMDEQKMTAH